MAKVVKPHQQTFPKQTIRHSNNDNISVPTYVAKHKFGFLKASKRSISQYRRYINRARRVQKSEPEASDNSISVDNISDQIPFPPQFNIPRTIPNTFDTFNYVESASSPDSTSLSSGVTNSFLSSEHKRARPEEWHPPGALGLDATTAYFYYRCRSSSSATHICIGQGKKEPLRLVCRASLVDEKHLEYLLSKEAHYHPNNAFLYYVNPDIEDKVDAVLRNEAVHNLRFMHNAFFNLTTETFCKAVNLIDRFIVKVKVKPKYMACVATASYSAACKLDSSKNKSIELPSPETLVDVTRCGGNAADLMRMEEILASKLAHNLDGVNALDFLQCFIDCIVKVRSDTRGIHSIEELDHGTTGNEKSLAESNKDTEQKTNIQGTVLYKRLGTLMEIALCSLEIYRFRPACLALAILAHGGIDGLLPLADLCRVDWLDIFDCASLVGQLYELYYRDPLPRRRRHHLMWPLSRRIRIGYSSPTPLDTISEVYEPVEDDEWVLPILFEP